MRRRFVLLAAIAALLPAIASAQSVKQSRAAGSTSSAVIVVPATGNSFPSNNGADAEVHGVVLLSPSGTPYAANGSGAGNVATGESSATTTATQTVAARTARQTLTIENESATPFRVGPPTLTDANGFLVPANGVLTLPGYTGALYTKTASGTAALSYLELY